MEIQARVLTLFVDALLNYEGQKPDSFTVNAWLLIQLLLIRRPDEAIADGLVLDPPWSSTVAYDQLSLKAKSILDTAQTQWDGSVTDDERAMVLDTCSDQLLMTVANFLSQLLVPADWRLHWMGVEG